MKLEKVFIRGWFQRTTIQLSKIYDFVRGGSSKLELDKKKLLKLRENLELKEIDHLAAYYEQKLSTSLNYIFSLGAPIPKELANIETVYP